MKQILFTLVFPFVLMLISEQLVSQSKAFELLNQLVVNKNFHSRLSYVIDYRSKGFSSIDTVYYRGEVILIRDTADQLFGGKIFMEFDKVLLGYDGLNIMYADIEKSTLEYIDPGTNPNAYIKSTAYNNLIDHSFLRGEELLLSFISNPVLNPRVYDTIINDIPCIGVNLTFPDAGGFTNEKYFSAFRKDTGYYFKKIYSVDFQGATQYDEWNYDVVQFDTERNIGLLDPDLLSSFQNIITPESKTRNEDTLSSLSFIMGEILNENKSYNIMDDTAAYILLDFWYSACYPCIKTIPVINRIALDFKEKPIAIYGVNPVDMIGKNEERINRFLSHNPMMYPTILPGGTSKEKLPQLAYPTIFLLDNDRNIIYQHSGYNEELYNELSSVLNKFLGN